MFVSLSNNNGAARISLTGVFASTKGSLGNTKNQSVKYSGLSSRIHRNTYNVPAQNMFSASTSSCSCAAAQTSWFTAGMVTFCHPIMTNAIGIRRIRIHPCVTRMEWSTVCICETMDCRGRCRKNWRYYRIHLVSAILDWNEVLSFIIRSSH